MAISDGSPLAPLPPGGSARLWWNRRRRQAIAVLALGLAYGAVYGNGIWTSLAHVGDRNRVLVAPTRGAVPDIIYLQTAMAVVFAAFAAVAVVRVRPQVWVGQWPWAQDRRPSTPTVLGAVGAVLSCYALADLVLIPGYVRQSERHLFTNLSVTPNLDRGSVHEFERHSVRGWGCHACRLCRGLR